MIEKILLEYLQEKLNIPVFLEKPYNPPKKMIIVEKTGSSKTNLIETATMAIQSYDESLVKTIALNEDVKAAMDEIEGLDSIGGCYLASDYNYTDTSTKQHRYQAVYNITYYGGNENG